jgi:murein DD-endopeptidase MepM/ murein hydrolase activator NlpD
VRAAARVIVLLVIAALAWQYRVELLRYLPSGIVPTSPHERYAAALRARGLNATELGRAWLDAADTAIAQAEAVRGTFTEEGEFDLMKPGAMAWRLPARRGQRIVVSAEFASGQLFLDLFDEEGDNVLAGHTAPKERRQDVPADDAPLEYDVTADGEFVLRAQPEILRAGPFRIAQATVASLAFPVRGISPRASHGPFGTPRDAGRRRHEGIDIFAPRGTPVVAAADGWITGSTTNRLGGNVVWLWSPSRRVALYYAHLDRHAVSRGERVQEGDVLGYVGTTGNARGTPPHLHFGIYATGDGAVDPAPFVIDPPHATSPVKKNSQASTSNVNERSQRSRRGQVPDAEKEHVMHPSR